MNDEARELTRIGLLKETNKIVNNYMTIFDEYYETGSRDSAFLKDLTDSLLGISAVLEVYARDKQIHPNYVIKKLENSRSYINACIKFYESRLENE